MATFTPQDVIAEARGAIQDTSVPYRYSDSDFLRAFNHCLKRIALMRPDLFAVTESFTCVAGALQTAPADSIRIIDVLQATTGQTINEVNRETLNLAYNTWPAGTTGAATDWMRNVRNPYQFFLYPPSAAAQTLLLQYSKSPSTLAVGTAVPTISDAYFPVLVDCLVWWMESYDNESVANKRAEMFQQSFRDLLGLTAQIKPITDTPEGGLTPEQVV